MATLTLMIMLVIKISIKVSRAHEVTDILYSVARLPVQFSKQADFKSLLSTILLSTITFRYVYYHWKFGQKIPAKLYPKSWKRKKLLGLASFVFASGFPASKHQ